MNGFPYKSAAEMGLQNDYQAFAVTKQAIYSVLDNRNINNYSGATPIGNVMANKVRELANIGRNGTQTYTDPVITSNAISEAGIDAIDSNYVSQTFSVDSQVNMKDIKIILNTVTAPEGTIVTNSNNNVKEYFGKGEHFKIMVPRNKIDKDINVQYSIAGQCETYPILYGKAPNANLQNYVLTTDPFIMSAAKGTMSYYKPTGEIEVQKISSDYSNITGNNANTGLKGAVFTVESKDGLFKKEVTTDEYGKFLLSGLDLKEYIITEVKAPDYYLKGKDVKFEVKLEFDGDKKNVIVENTPVDIEVHVEKEADKNEAQGKELVTYEIDKIQNKSNVKLENFTLTDYLPKEVRIVKLETGTYNEDLSYSVEYNTNKKSNVKLQENLSTKNNNIVDFSNIKLDSNEYITSYTLKFGTVKIGFNNTSKMKITTKVVEGLVDKSTFTNNVNVFGTYLEARADDNDDKTVKVYENILKINKVSKEYNQYTDLPEGSKINAVFDLLDENKEYITTLKVTNTEDFVYKYLETGKVYYLKEISTDPYYIINDELTEFKFEQNGQVIDLTIKNDNVNLVVDVEKDGPTEVKQGEEMTYEFNSIGNFSNVAVSNFVWGDILPRQVALQKIETGTWNEELEYEIKYITNRNTNWVTIGKYNTTDNNTIDMSNIELAEGEYIKEFKLCFGDVKSGFTQIEAPKVTVKVNEDLPNGKIFVNKTYVTASYEETNLREDDDCHTVVYTKEDIKEEILPKTGF